MNTTVDGEYQKLAVESGAYIREHFFGPDPRLRKMVEDLSDDELRLAAARRPRLPQALRGLQAGHRAAGRPDRHPGQDDQGVDARARDRGAQRHPPDQEDDQGAAARAARPPVPHRRHPRLRARGRPTLHPPGRGVRRHGVPARPGPRPRRAGAGPRGAPRSPPLRPDAKVFEEFAAGSGAQAVSTTMVFARLLRNLVRDPTVGSLVAPIVSDEARTFGLEPLIAEAKIYAPEGQHYIPVDADLPLNYAESTSGQVLQEGITEAGALAQLHRPRHGLRHLGPAHGAGLPLLFDVRVPAGGRPGLGARRHARPGHPGRAARRGAPRSRARGSSTTTGSRPSSPRPTRPPWSTTPPSPTRWPTIMEAAVTEMLGPRAQGPLLVPHALQRELPHAGPPRGGRGGGRPPGHHRGHLPLRRGARRARRRGGLRASLCFSGPMWSVARGGPARSWPSATASPPTPGP